MFLHLRVRKIGEWKVNVSEHVLAGLDGKNSVLACSSIIRTASVRAGVKNSVHEQQKQPVCAPFERSLRCYQSPFADLIFKALPKFPCFFQLLVLNNVVWRWHKIISYALLLEV